MTMGSSVLDIEIRQQVDYFADIADPSLFATDPGVTTAAPPKNFFVVTLIGDIRSVNGQPTRGTYVGRTRVIKASPAPMSGSGGAIADVTRTAMREHIFEIRNAAERQIGTIMSTGFSGGQAPPGAGAPQDGKGGNWAIVGGTGAYLGARGQLRGLGQVGRAASMTEDPGRRLVNTPDDHPVHFILRVIPMHAPEILTAATGPLIFNADHTLVTEFTPAIANHDVSLFATGLGPTHPDFDLEQPFPSGPPAVVDSPVVVTVDGLAAQNVHAVGNSGYSGRIPS